MSDKPYIYTFRTSENCYVYDVNTVKILAIPETAYNYLSCNGEVDVDNGTLDFIENLKANGFLRSDRVETTKHPATSLLPYYLKNKLDQLILQVTQSCNLRCSYCVYSGSYKTRTHSQRSMSVDIADKAIDYFMKRSKDNKRIAISFYGGEPLLNIELVKHCVDYIKTRYYGKEIYFGMTTNGTMLDDDSVAFLADNGFHLIISLDGPQEIHDRRRRFASNNEGTFSIIMDNCELIKKRYPDYYQKNVAFNTVLDTSQMFGRLSDFVSSEPIISEGNRFLLNYVSNHFTDQKLDISDDFYADREYEYFKLLLSKLGELSRDKTSYLLAARFIDMYLYCFQNIEMDNKHIPLEFHHSGPCIPGSTRLFVDANGKFFPCERVNELSETVALGDVDSGISLEKVTEILNIETATHERCQNCWAYRQCTICVASADDMKGVSDIETMKECLRVCKATDSKIKDYCVLRELGYTFDEERMQGANDVWS
jgi:uncharacterized protein